MKYVSTLITGGEEIVVVALPLSIVPDFDPANPPQEGTYGASDEVEVGWVKQEDGSFAPPESPIVAPITVSKYKFRKALNQLGLREAVEAAVAASEDIEVQDAWAYADVYSSDDPLVIALGTALGKTEEEIRAVFELAQTL